VQRTSAQLKKECRIRGIIIPDKITRKAMIKLLMDYHFKKIDSPSWGRIKRNELESPMLCFSFKHLKEKEKHALLNSPDYIAEKKEDGVRMLPFYHPDEGFTFFSRNISVVDFQPIEYTDKILLIKDGVITTPGQWKGVFKKSFILDGECFVKKSSIDTTVFRKYGTVCETALDAVTAILSINAKDSHEIQKTQCQLFFKEWDILEVGETPVWRNDLHFRKKVLNKVVRGGLEKQLPFSQSEVITTGKKKYFDQLVAGGCEGIVLKNLYKPYVRTDSRRRDTQVKLKRSMNESLGSDLDAFISGFVPATEGKEWSDLGLIGSLKMSVLIKGSKNKEHHICSISSVPLDLRKEMSMLDDNGNPCLKEEYYNRVLIVNGQDISGKSKRIMHAEADWIRGFRTDKTYLDCVLSEDVLKKLVL